jgi:hypothetical protein
MHKTIWTAACAMLIVAPCARADTININITESSPNTITFNSGDPMFTRTQIADGNGVWTINTRSDLANPFQFETGQETFYFQEPNPNFLNVVTIVSSAPFNISRLVVSSDYDWTQGGTITLSPFFAMNNTPREVGFDTDGNGVSITFNDSLSPDPADVIPEPASLFLVGSGVLMAILRARSRNEACR